MNMVDEIVYLRKRETEEMTAAVTSTDVCAIDAHLGLAERYADRIWALEEGYA